MLALQGEPTKGEDELGARSTDDSRGGSCAYVDESFREYPDHGLLWIADIVAGVVRADSEGESEYKQILSERIYDLEVQTDC